MATAVEPHDKLDDDHSNDHDDWHHKQFSAHHFENSEQQFDSGKLGMWIFLITEVLFFSGLFCAYAVFRAHHPEVFEYASQYLNKYLGGLNTVVLIFSSLTMAWAVRCAQLGNRGGLITMLSITLFCAALFLGVKTFEYTEKAHKRLLWAGASVESKDIGKAVDTHVFQLGKPLPPEHFEERMMESLGSIQKYWFFAILAIPTICIAIGYQRRSRPWRTCGYAVLVSIAGIMIGIAFSIELHNMQHGGGGSGEHAPAKHASAEQHAEHPIESAEQMIIDEKVEHNAPRNANLFFSIYYFMTGLHGFHIVAGMIAISWLLVRAVESHFRPDYFGPVDYVGLYWHIVDLIWIFLFPLLYLIGSDGPTLPH